MLLDPLCQEFIAENHSVSRSNQLFAQVWPDMALEQSINLETKTKGDIIGMSTKEDAVDRWFLTIHGRAAMTYAPKEVCGPENYDRIGTQVDNNNKNPSFHEEQLPAIATCSCFG